jgi:hypothetical protein
MTHHLFECTIAESVIVMMHMKHYNSTYIKSQYNTQLMSDNVFLARYINYS